MKSFCQIFMKIGNYRQNNLGKAKSELSIRVQQLPDENYEEHRSVQHTLNLNLVFN